jgi:hypothetical protein
LETHPPPLPKSNKWCRKFDEKDIEKARKNVRTAGQILNRAPGLAVQLVRTAGTWRKKIENGHLRQWSSYSSIYTENRYFERQFEKKSINNRRLSEWIWRLYFGRSSK